MSFKCKMCGMCCRDVNRYKEEVYPVLKKILGDKIPEFDIEATGGVCVNLNEDNRCMIYDCRPIICNTEKMFEMLSEALEIPKRELYNAQVLSCKCHRIR